MVYYLHMHPLRLFVASDRDGLSAHLVAAATDEEARGELSAIYGRSKTLTGAAVIEPEALAKIMGVSSIDPINAASALRYIALEYETTPAERRTLTAIAKRIEESFFRGS